MAYRGHVKDCMVRTWKLVRHNLKFLIVICGGGFTVWKYFDGQAELRKAAARQLAIENVVVSGFLSVASELEASGQQVRSAWSDVNTMKNVESEEDLQELRRGLAEDERFKIMLCGANARFADAVARISIIDGYVYYVLVNCHGHLCEYAKIVAFTPIDKLVANPVIYFHLAGGFSRFGVAVATKASEILIDDDRLAFDIEHIRRNSRFVALVAVCKEFKKRHKEWSSSLTPQQDKQSSSQLTTDFLQWMVRAVDNNGDIGSI